MEGEGLGPSRREHQTSDWGRGQAGVEDDNGHGQCSLAADDLSRVAGRGTGADESKMTPEFFSPGHWRTVGPLMGQGSEGGLVWGQAGLGHGLTQRLGLEATSEVTRVPREEEVGAEEGVASWHSLLQSEGTACGKGPWQGEAGTRCDAGLTRSLSSGFAMPLI